jgi:hypothetical protein
LAAALATTLAAAVAAAVVSVVVLPVVVLAVAPLAPVGVLAPLDAVPGLLGLNVIRRDTSETANERQRGEHSDNATPGASGGEGADEGIKSTWVHRFSPSLMARGGTGVGHCQPCANAFLQTLSILVQRCQKCHVATLRPGTRMGRSSHGPRTATRHCHARPIALARTTVR